jgi:hypothetical protein
MTNHSGSSTPHRVGRGAVGLLLGLFVGLAITLSILALRAAIQNVYIHGFGEVLGWMGLPVLVLPIFGAVVGFSARKREAWFSFGATAGGLVGGIAGGTLVGGLVTAEASGPWAGGIVGGAAGALVAAAWSGRHLVRRHPAHAAAALVAPLLASACAAPDAPREARLAPPPEAERVEAVLYLLGDPGVGRMESFPVLPEMRRDMEAWSERLDSTSHAAMAVLGDIVYPDGLHPPADPTRTTDSLRVADQIGIVSTPPADEVGARAYFIPGNHDWGQEEDWAGARRLVGLDRFLQSWSGSARGRVFIAPEPGTGGPQVIDMGEHLRLVALDTGWWLLGAEEGEKDAVIEGIRRAVEGADGRKVVMAAHHPLESGGPHGTFSEFGSTLGLRVLLREAGILLQDLDSRPYQDLLRRLDEVFHATGGPDVFAGGHEHSLQVFGPQGEDVTRGLVVGSASKLTGVSMAPHMKFGRSEPGYAKLFALDDGSLHIRFEAAPARYLKCDGESQNQDRCMDDALRSFRTVWAETIE